MGMNAGFLGSEKLMDAAGRPSFVVGEVVGRVSDAPKQVDKYRVIYFTYSQLCV